MDPNITFEFEGKMYMVSNRACDVPYIVLPDGRLLEAESWLESYPPQPQGLHEVNHAFKAMRPVAIAFTMNGVVAVEMEVRDATQ